MRLALLRRCAKVGTVAAASPPAILAPQTTAATALFEHCLDPRASPSDVARFTSDLLPFLSAGALDLRQQQQVLHMLATRSIRNEDVMLRCLWDTFKAPLATTTTVTELAAFTTRAFRVMAEQQLTNDPQMTAIALGRCVELAPHLSLDGLCDAYTGLRAVDHMFFSTAEVAHHSSEVTTQMTTKEFYEMDGDVDTGALRHQPNLIDVLCGELELQLRRWADSVLPAPSNAARSGTALVPSSPPASSSAPVVTAQEPQQFLNVLAALATVGVQQAGTLDCLSALIPRYRDTGASSGFFIYTLDHATRIAQRVADPLYFTESAEVQDARRGLVRRLSKEVQCMPKVAGYLRRHPQELLLLRRLFEREAATDALSPALWDTIRTMHVAHHHTVAHTQTSTRPVGKLFDKRYDVKVQSISVDNSESERFVPPEFKTWRNPAATPRGGHQRNRRAPRQIAFGTRRISKNYIKTVRKKFCPSPV